MYSTQFTDIQYKNVHYNSVQLISTSMLQYTLVLGLHFRVMAGFDRPGDDLIKIASTPKQKYIYKCLYICLNWSGFSAPLSLLQ